MNATLVDRADQIGLTTEEYIKLTTQEDIMMYTIVNALGRPASSHQVEAISRCCNHSDVWRVKGTLLFDVDSLSGVANLKKIALQFGLFASADIS